MPSISNNLYRECLSHLDVSPYASLQEFLDAVSVTRNDADKKQLNKNQLNILVTIIRDTKDGFLSKEKLRIKVWSAGENEYSQQAFNQTVFQQDCQTLLNWGFLLEDDNAYSVVLASKKPSYSASNVIPTLKRKQIENSTANNLRKVDESLAAIDEITQAAKELKQKLTNIKNSFYSNVHSNSNITTREEKCDVNLVLSSQKSLSSSSVEILQILNKNEPVTKKVKQVQTSNNLSEIEVASNSSSQVTLGLENSLAEPNSPNSHVSEYNVPASQWSVWNHSREVTGREADNGNNLQFPTHR